MNLAQLSETLKGLPDDSITKAVKGGDQNIPPYLALTEMQRRKDMRTNYEGAKASAAQTTVADDMLSQGQNLGGDINNPSAQGIMRGAGQAQMMQGIKDQSQQPQRFAGGGPVQKFEGGGTVLGRDKYGNRINARYHDYQDWRHPSDALGGNADPANFKSMADDYPTGENDFITPTLDWMGRQVGVFTDPWLPNKSEAEKLSAEAPQGTGSVPPWAQKGVDVAKVDAAAPLPAKGKPTPTGNPAVAGGLSGSSEQAEMAATKQFAEAAAAQGNDPFDALADMLAKSYAGINAQKGNDRNMALMTAGLGIAAGESPFFATNVGKGAMAGIDQWNQSAAERERKAAGLEDRQIDLAMKKEDRDFTREEFGWKKDMAEREFAMQTQLQQGQLAIQQAELAMKSNKMQNPMILMQMEAYKAEYEAIVKAAETNGDFSTVPAAQNAYFTKLRALGADVGPVDDLSDPEDMEPWYSPATEAAEKLRKSVG